MARHKITCKATQGFDEECTCAEKKIHCEGCPNCGRGVCQIKHVKFRAGVNQITYHCALT